MSNPAVTKLRRLKIDNNSFWTDDNIGEAIHFHLDDIRIDFSVKSFDRFCKQLVEVINKLVNVEGFDLNRIDPQYFEFMLWENVLNLKEIRYDTVKLSQLVCPDQDGHLVSLPESRLVKAIQNNTANVRKAQHTDHIGQNADMRLDDVKELIKDKGYPYNDQYIILYNDDFIIQDGQHRAACIYTEKGDIEIKVQRFIFDNYVTRSSKKPFRYTTLGSLVFCAIHPIYTLRLIINKANTFREAFRQNRKLKSYLKKNGHDYAASLKVLDSK